MSKTFKRIFLLPTIISFLAVAMLTNLLVHVPEVVTGLVGLCFVVLAYRSSLREMAMKS